MHLCNTVVFLMLQAVFWLSIGVFCLLFFSGSGYKEQSDKMYSKHIQNTSKTHPKHILTLMTDWRLLVKEACFVFRLGRGMV